MTPSSSTTTRAKGSAPVSVPLNTLVIRAAQPVVVDTGVAANHDQFLTDVFSLVDPDHLRWVVLSHDDVDHTGNVNALVAAAPNATLVANWFINERMGATLAVPPTRQRWLDDGEHLDVGDRRLYALRPPVYDSPTTRGLYDTATGVYWASDCFATPTPTPVSHVAELDDRLWQAGLAMFAHYLSPWLDLVDGARFQRCVNSLASLKTTAIAGAHTPVIAGSYVPRAVELIRDVASVNVPAQPGQAVLEGIQRTMAAAAT